jgi:signal transduction histidine kinase/HPt (histidine-containing phosphotransfer) domain-containing protein
MSKTLRVLNIEDKEQDTVLNLRHLSRAGYELITDRVETAEAMKTALEARKWDVILCDYSMPRFSALAALALMKEMNLDIPFIIISGTIGEELAVEAMIAGAHGYLVKGKLAQLASTIERELQGAENRRARRAMEAELEITRDAALESARLKSEFLANMSHEIRTPMNGVIGMTRLLLETKLSKRQLEFTKAIEISATALLKIIDDILDFSKIEAGKLQFEKIDFDLRYTVGLALEMLAKRAQTKGIKMTSLINSELPELLCGDPGRLQQILTNLICNAVKFTQKGEVAVNVLKESETKKYIVVRFEIRDTGIGISDDAQRKLFCAFVQADGSTTRKYGGTGLGLAISKQLVKLMDGEIGVESKPGEGSTFWFTARFEKPVRQLQLHYGLVKAMAEKPVNINNNHLPRRIKQPSLRDTKNQAKVSKARILVVEDNAINREVALNQLKVLGYLPNAVFNGQEAVEALKNKKYAAVLMDCQMPDMDGFEATAEIRRLEGNSNHTIIIAMTANAMEGDREKCLAAGMDDYLSKPVKLEALRRILEQWIIHAERKVEVLPEESNGHYQKEPSEIVDISVLADLTSLQQPGKSNLVNRLIKLFIEGANKNLSALGKAVAEDNPAAIRREAHSIKGSAGNIGARQMAALSKELEQKAHLNTEAKIIISKLEGVFKQVVKVLDSIRQEERIIERI